MQNKTLTLILPYLIGIGLVLLVLLTALTLSFAADRSELKLQLNEAASYLNTYGAWAASEGPNDLSAAFAMQNALVELDNQVLLNTWNAYQYCNEEDADYYWERFTNALLTETEKFVQETQNRQ